MQDRKRRPTGSTGDASADGEQAVQVDIGTTTAIEKALKDAADREKAEKAKKLANTPCGCGCWCEPCLHNGCAGHVDPILRRKQYMAGERRK